MEWSDTTRGIVIGLAAVTVVAGGFVGGVVLGVGAGERIEASWTASISAGLVARSQRTLELLDQRRYGRIREEANVALDAGLLATCVGLGAQGSGAGEAQEASRRLLRAVAEYRQAVPPSYPPEWAANRGPALEQARATVSACLASALARPSR